MDYPQKYFITSGKGNSEYKLVAFDNALIEAGISNYNLVKVSSILPKRCQKQSSMDLEYGSPLLTAFATVSSDEPGKHLATAVAAGIPKNPDDIGVIMETSGELASETEERVKNMVIEAMNNHHIPLDHIECSSAEGVVKKGWLSLVSAITLW